MVWLLLDPAGVAVPGRGEVEGPSQVGMGVLGWGPGISCLQSGWSTAKPSWDPNKGGLQALEASGTLSFLPCWQLWLHRGAACTNLHEQNSTASELLPMKFNSGFPKAISLFHQPHQGRV